MLPIVFSLYDDLISENYFNFEYSSSLTASSHSLEVSVPGTSTAR